MDRFGHQEPCNKVESLGAAESLVQSPEIISVLEILYNRWPSDDLKSLVTHHLMWNINLKILNYVCVPFPMTFGILSQISLIALISQSFIVLATWGEQCIFSQSLPEFKGSFFIQTNQFVPVSSRNKESYSRCTRSL